jgi:hypothetical protein
MSLPTLAVPDDIALRLGRDLTDAESIRVPALLADASAQIRRYCRRDFLLHTDESAILYGHDSIILLPQYPVQSGPSVVAIGGGMGLPNVPIPWYTFDGVRKIRIDPGHGIINLPEIWWTSDLYPGTFEIVYSYGYETVPDDVVMVCANAALSVLTAPTMAAGLIGETIGPYSYRLERSGGGVAVALNAGDLAALADYRVKTGTIITSLR